MTTSRTHGCSLAVNGFDLHYDVRGDGTPLVLLHGLTGTSKDWVHLLDVEAWSRRYRLIMPDLRGHGRSTNPSGAFSFRQCALDVLALLDHLKLERVLALGVSLGAKALLHLATEQPSRVTSMILVSATPRFPESTRALLRAAATEVRGEDHWSAMRTRHVHGDDQIRALFHLPARLADDTRGMSFTATHLGAIAARTLLVAGDRDPLYPVELAVELYRGLPRASLWVVPDGGHSPVFGAVAPEFARHAARFFELCDSGL